MKKITKIFLSMLCAASLLTGCASQNEAAVQEETKATESVSKKVFEGATEIYLSDDGITVDGEAISEDTQQAVYVAKDIIFYLAGQDFTYGAGTEADAHTQEEADAHTVVHISEPGTYALSGSLSKGQIAVDLGEDAKKDPEAVVTLILNGVDIQCDVAPAVIFYKVYECGSDEAETATMDVDTSAAGANVILADGTVNNVTGSYVARIYKSYELNEAGTEVVSNKKLHKYDGAFYSKMSMNVNGDELGTGVLNIVAENEGLDTELHLTVNGGNINIRSGNDGINTNEDEVSVTTINGGTLNICVTGETGEGDGIDSNGWIVINGGTIFSQACSKSMDAGIDSDMGIYVNGGTVYATGNMYDHMEDDGQSFAVFSFAASQKGGSTYTLKNEAGEAVAAFTPENDFTYFIFSDAALTEGTYTFWQGDTQLAAVKGENSGFGGSFGGGERPEMPEGMEIPEEMPKDGGMPEPPEGMELPKDGERPEMPEGMELPKDGEMPQKPDGETDGAFAGHGFGGRGEVPAAETEELFEILSGANFFNFVSATKE